MKPLKTFGCYFVLLLFLQAAEGCSGSTANSASSSDTAVQKDAPIAGKQNTSDEALFRQFLARFKAAVTAKNKAQLTTLFFFPLQTAPQWTNDELKNTTVTPKESQIGQKEFLTYFDDIFTKDAVKLIPASTEDDLSEIDKATTESYYKTLQQVTDKSSTLYELQKQYTEDNGKETSFGFVFGRVGGAYKIISYYRPWPLK